MIHGRRDIGRYEYRFEPPSAGVGVTPDLRVAPHQVVRLTTGAADSDPGDPVSVRWTLSDGSSSAERTVFREYDSVGSYEERLTLTDGAGLSSQASVTITVARQRVMGLTIDPTAFRPNRRRTGRSRPAARSATRLRYGARRASGSKGRFAHGPAGRADGYGAGQLQAPCGSRPLGASMARVDPRPSSAPWALPPRGYRRSGQAAPGALSHPPLAGPISFRLMKQQLRPLFDQVVIKELDPDRVRRSGLLLPPGEHETPPQHGIVLAVGPGLDWWGGVGIKMPVAPGDHVVFAGSAGVWVEVEEERLLVCRVGQLLGVLEEIDERSEDRLGGGSVAGTSE